MTFKGEIFIDATYEGNSHFNSYYIKRLILYIIGDMMAYAGAKYEIGREGRAKYGELNAGRVFQEWKSNEFLLGSTGESDDLLPAYALPLCSLSFLVYFLPVAFLLYFFINVIPIGTRIE